MRYIVRLAALVLIFALLMVSAKAHAFAVLVGGKESTHPLLTRRILKALNIVDPTLVEAIIAGTISEDVGPPDAMGNYQVCYVRPFNHFFNPQTGKPFYDCFPYKSLSDTYSSSTDWIISPGLQRANPVPFNAIEAIAIANTDCGGIIGSVRPNGGDVKACSGVSQFLAGTTPIDCSFNTAYPDGDRTWLSTLDHLFSGPNEKELAFHGLGHVIHVIQDAGVPDHSRGDPHPDITEYGLNSIQRFGASILEQWASGSGAVEPQVTAQRHIDELILDFTKTPNDDPLATIQKVAGFSSDNFYSKSTISHLTGCPPPLPEPLVKYNQVISVSADAAKKYLHKSTGYTGTYRVMEIGLPGKIPIVTGISGLGPGEIPICRSDKMPAGAQGYIDKCWLADRLVQFYTWQVLGRLVAEASAGIIKAFTDDRQGARVVDDASSGTTDVAEIGKCDTSVAFCMRGPTPYWHDIPSGFRNHGWWTQANDGKAHSDQYYQNKVRRIENRATWRPNVPFASNYNVEVYVPGTNATSANVRYNICYDLEVQCFVVNQAQSHDKWISLGVHSFDPAKAPPAVFVHDLTFEPYATTTIAVDAARIRSTELANGVQPVPCLADEVEVHCGDYPLGSDLPSH